METVTPQGETKQIQETGTKALEVGGLAVTLSAPEALVEAADLTVDFHLTHEAENDRARQVIETLGPDYTVHTGGTSAWLTWERGRDHVTMFCSGEVAAVADPERHDYPRFRRVIVDYLQRGDTAPVKRSGEDGDGVAFAGIAEDGRFEVGDRDGALGIYTSLDAMLRDGWIPA